MVAPGLQQGLNPVFPRSPTCPWHVEAGGRSRSFAEPQNLAHPRLKRDLAAELTLWESQE